MNDTQTPLQPKFITFDMLGTLTKLEWGESTTRLVSDVLSSPEEIQQFVDDFDLYRNGVVIGAYRPYPQIIRDSWQITCNKWGIQFRQSDVDALLDDLTTWGPQPDAVETLQRLAAKFPLAVYTNHCDSLVMHNVEKLGVDFARVFTAEQGQAYKPNYAAFHYMFDHLNVTPNEVFHVSSHLWYDWLPAKQLGVENQAYIDRGWDPDIQGVGAWIAKLPDVADRLGA